MRNVATCAAVSLGGERPAEIVPPRAATTPASIARSGPINLLSETATLCSVLGVCCVRPSLGPTTENDRTVFHRERGECLGYNLFFANFWMARPERRAIGAQVIAEVEQRWKRASSMPSETAKKVVIDVSNAHLSCQPNRCDGGHHGRILAGRKADYHLPLFRRSAFLG